jgi:hypothetical protein
MQVALCDPRGRRDSTTLVFLGQVRFGQQRGRQTTSTGKTIDDAAYATWSSAFGDATTGELGPHLRRSHYNGR